MCGMKIVAMSYVSVVSRFRMVAFSVMFGRFLMMFRCMFMVLCSLLVMIGNGVCFHLGLLDYMRVDALYGCRAIGARSFGTDRERGQFYPFDVTENGAPRRLAESGAGRSDGHDLLFATRSDELLTNNVLDHSCKFSSGSEPGFY